MRERVDFWKKVYTEIKSTQAFIHDSEDLNIIYKKIELPRTRKARKRKTKFERKKLKRLLISIAKKGSQNLTRDEEALSKLIEKKTKKEIKQLSRNIRFQYGLRDRYYQGLLRSYLYMDYIKSTFKKLRLPPELIFLPHVESSFNYNAYSKVGAAGIWQFMRTTGKSYKLNISYVIDERRDPFKATVAAGKLLRDNYRILKSWPLALTAYNHGARSIQRAIKGSGSREINKIIQNYKGRRFGFASKNFYATFMATVEISKNPSLYFSSFTPPNKLLFSKIKLTKSLTISEITSAIGIKQNVIKRYNPSIRRSAFKSRLYLPKDFELKLPESSPATLKKYNSKLASLRETINSLDFQRTHIVSRGENLYDISRLYNSSISKIIMFNNIINPSRIYPGLKIKIPGSRDKVTQIKLSKKKIPKPHRTPIIAKNSEKSTPYQLKSNFFLKLQPRKSFKFNTSALPAPSPAITLKDYKLDLTPISPNVYQVRVETQETLGHFSDWAKVRIKNIRSLNNLKRSSHITMGGKLKIRIPKKNLRRFKQMRNEYHLSIQEDFYNTYKVIAYSSHKVSRGESISIILRNLSIPFWLARKKIKKDILHLKQGQIITLPTIEPINSENDI